MDNLDDTLLVKKLEQLSASITHCINDQDFDFSTPLGQEMITRVSPKFEAILGNGAPIPMSWDTLMGALKGFFKAKPEAHHTIRNISSYMDHKPAEAFVYVELGMEGADPGLTVHGMSTYMWKKNGEGRWMLFRYWNMRNIGGNGGFA